MRELLSVRSDDAEETDGVLMLPNDAASTMLPRNAARTSPSVEAADDALETVSTRGAAELGGGASGNQHAGTLAGVPAAHILGALQLPYNHAASATALQLASVIAAMPPLPASTAQLPPRGTAQRRHIETAIELAFAQLSLTAHRAAAPAGSV